MCEGFARCLEGPWVQEKFLFGFEKTLIIAGTPSEAFITVKCGRFFL